MTDGRVISEFERGFRHGVIATVTTCLAVALIAALSWQVARAAGAALASWQVAPQPVAAPVPQAPAAAASSAKGLESACMGYWFGDTSMNKAEIRRRVCGK